MRFCGWMQFCVFPRGGVGASLRVCACACVPMSLCVCVCVCVYLQCVYVCTHARMHSHVRVCERMCVHARMCAHARARPCVRVHAFVSACVCACLCARALGCTCVRVRMHVRTRWCWAEAPIKHRLSSVPTLGIANFDGRTICHTFVIAMPRAHSNFMCFWCLNAVKQCAAGANSCVFCV